MYDASSQTNVSRLTLPATADNLPLSVLCSFPAEGVAPVAVLQLVHGMCEYKERYLPFMHYLSDKGFVCVIHDHRGHGETLHGTADLGYFYTGGYRAMVDDILVVTRYIKEQYPHLPCFLFGHSMGSLAVRSYTKLYDEQIDGLIVCGSPSYNPAGGFGKCLARMIMRCKGDRHRSRFLQWITFGSFNSKFPDAVSPHSWVCSDPEVVRNYDADPKCNFVFTTNGFYNLYSLMLNAYDKRGWAMHRPELPIGFFAGEDDPCIGSVRKFLSAVNRMREVGYKQVAHRLYPHLRHEILHEKGKEHVYEDMYNLLQSWINPNRSLDLG